MNEKLVGKKVSAVEARLTSLLAEHPSLDNPAALSGEEEVTHCHDEMADILAELDRCKRLLTSLRVVN